MNASTDDLKTLKGCWDQFAKENKLNKTPLRFHEALRTAFYSGCGSTIAAWLLINQEPAMSNEEAVALFDGLHDEVLQFMRDRRREPR